MGKQSDLIKGAAEQGVVVDYKTIIHDSTVHLNGNLVCSIDLETTGTNPERNEIIQIAVVPLDAHFNVSKLRIPFEILIRPMDAADVVKDPESKISKKLLQRCLSFGVPDAVAADMFEQWYNKLGLPEGKRIVPLGYNYAAFDRDFLIRLFGGVHTYEHYFHHSIRDLMLVAHYLNDRADAFAEEVPFAKYTLGAVCTRLNVVNEDPHNALCDAVATAKAYKTALTMFIK